MSGEYVVDGELEKLRGCRPFPAQPEKATTSQSRQLWTQSSIRTLDWSRSAESFTIKPRDCASDNDGCDSKSLFPHAETTLSCVDCAGETLPDTIGATQHVVELMSALHFLSSRSVSRPPMRSVLGA